MTLKEQLQARLKELTDEMSRVATEAANQAALPYQAAIGEVNRMIALIDGGVDGSATSD